jgi:arylsulfatase A-like enzyme
LRTIALTFLIVLSTSLAAAEPKNVILIVIDTLSAKHLPSYGYARNTTPFLSQFARENVLFEKHSAQAAYTLTSHFSMMTGTNPHTHGILKVPELTGAPLVTLNSEIKTLAELLKDKGYATRWVGLVDAPQMGKRQGLQRGIDKAELGSLYPQPLFSTIDELAKSKKKFFLFIHVEEVHDPYLPLNNYHKLFTTSAPRKLELDRTKFYDSVRKKLKLKPGALVPWQEVRKAYLKQFNFQNEHDRNLLAALYDGAIRTFDDAFNAFITKLEAAGLYDNTILVLTSDHGEAFWEKGDFFHTTPYHAEIQVPLIMRIPGQAPRRISMRSQSIDLVPTILDLVGERAPAYTEGLSLVPLLKDKKIKRDWSQLFFAKGYQSEALWSEEWKLIEFDDGRVELYNLYLDPYEAEDVAAANPGIVNEMKAKLVDHRLKRQRKPE